MLAHPLGEVAGDPEGRPARHQGRPRRSVAAERRQPVRRDQHRDRRTRTAARRSATSTSRGASSSTSPRRRSCRGPRSSGSRRAWWCPPPNSRCRRARSPSSRSGRRCSFASRARAASTRSPRAILVTYAAFGAVARTELRAAERLTPGIVAVVSVAEPSYTVVAAGDPSTPITAAPIATFTEAAQLGASNGGGRSPISPRSRCDGRSLRPGHEAVVAVLGWRLVARIGGWWTGELSLLAVVRRGLAGRSPVPTRSPSNLPARARFPVRVSRPPATPPPSTSVCSVPAM